MRLSSVRPVSDQARWAIYALDIHRSARSFFGLGRRMCGMCDSPWGDHGCVWRRAAINAVHAHLEASARAALADEHLLTRNEATEGLAQSRPPRRRSRWRRPAQRPIGRAAVPAIPARRPWRSPDPVPSMQAVTGS